MSESQSLSVASYEFAARQQQRIMIPRRYTVPMREMIALQPRFLQTRGKRALNLLDHRRFRAAYDFMLLRSEVGQFSRETADFWTHVQTLPADQRAGSFGLGRAADRTRRRPRRRRRRNPEGKSA